MRAKFMKEVYDTDRLMKLTFSNIGLWPRHYGC